ncbi:MAG: Ger(x)C family spore germination C-terminal domain-containing protein [Oscillospiraceae bacterium]|nr:Ger(x)C family spore germination C-terminal domain-containing protein [Oscillospiraceae bacterium]
MRNQFKLNLKLNLILCLYFCIFLTGCSSESIADRVYTQAIGLTTKSEKAGNSKNPENPGESGIFTLYTQEFNQDAGKSVTGADIPEVLRLEQAVNGGKVFTGHTELLCLDGTCTLKQTENLLLEQGLSPACKILYTDPAVYFKNPDSTGTVHMIRMSEQNGLLSSTELSTALAEWQGFRKTALIPMQKESQDYPALVFLHQDGTCQELSDAAAKGMYWLRRNTESFTMTLATPDGTQNIFISSCKLKKTIKNQVLNYEITIKTKDSSPELQGILQKEILRECHAAVSEMNQAKADVIGMQDVLEHENVNSKLDPNIDPELKLSVIIK